MFRASATFFTIPLERLRAVSHRNLSSEQIAKKCSRPQRAVLGRKQKLQVALQAGSHRWSFSLAGEGVWLAYEMPVKSSHCSARRIRLRKN